MAEETRAKLTLDGDITPLRQKLREAGDDLKRFGASGGRDIDNLSSNVMKLTSRFTALGAVLSIGGLTAIARQAIDAADSLNDLATRTQTSVKALASFQLIAQQSDTDLQSLGKGLNKLSVFMVENADEAKKLGITARDPVQAFLQFADALDRAATPQDRAAIANRVLGKSFQDLLPLLSLGSTQLREAAAASEEYAQKLEKLSPRASTFNDRLDEMKLRWDALKVSMGSGFLDLLPNSMTMDKASARIIELKGNIGSLQRALEGSPGSGLLHRWLYGNKDEITAKLAAARKELADLTAQKTADASGKPQSGGTLTFADIVPPKKAGKGEQSHMAEYEAQLAARKNQYEQENLLRQFSKEQELAYWRELQQAHSLSSNDRLAIAKRTATLELEIRRQNAKEQRDLDAAMVDSRRAAALYQIQLEEQQANSARENGAITQRELIAQQEEFARRRFEIEYQSLMQRLEMAKLDPNTSPAALLQIKEQMLEIERQYVLRRGELQQQAMVESTAIWRSLTDTITGLWDKGIQALMNGTFTWSNAFRAVGAQMVSWFATEVVGKQVKEWIAGQAKMLAVKLGFMAAEKTAQTAASGAITGEKAKETIAVVASNAAQAGSGAAASVAPTPFVGPMLALAAMAAVFGAVMALGGRQKSAAKGFDIPKGLNPMTQLHEEEMVLPAKFANVIRGMAAGGEGGQGGGITNHHYHISALDAKSFERFAHENKRIFAGAVKSAGRDGFK